MKVNQKAIQWDNPGQRQAFNPYLPSYEYIADGEPHVFGDRLYVFGSHDLFNSEDFCLGDYMCYSAPLTDLSDWRCDGVIYRKEQDPRNADGKMHMCAPDVARGRDGRYYLYYQLHILTYTSVAVADRPEGPYEFYGYVQHPDGIPWGEKKGDAFVFDPGVLMDDDGTAYLYAGFSPLPGAFKKIMKMRGNNVEDAFCFKLNSDMITVDGEAVPVVPGAEKARGTEFEGHAFYEASSPRKIGDRYYLIYSSELSHELCYAVSDRPDGGFTYGGTIISIGNVGYEGNQIPDNYTGNTHGGMVKINGQWYIFYHRQTNLQKCARQACAEKVTVLPDGRILQAETTSCGLNGGPLYGFGTYEARIASTLVSRQGTIPCVETHEKNPDGIYPFFTQSGQDREDNPDQYIANMRDGATAGFRYYNFEDLLKIGVTIRKSTYQIEKKSLFGRKHIRCNEPCKGVMQVRLEREGKIIAEIPVDETQFSEGWFTTGLADIKQPYTGISGLYFTYQGSGSIDFAAFTMDSVWNPKILPPEIDKRRVLCVGDSITYGQGVLFEREKYSYPAQLEKLLGDTYQVLNYGLPGRTLMREGDIPYVLDRHYDASKQTDPETVILMLGTNDAKYFNWDEEKYREQLRQMIREYKSLPNISQMIVMCPPRAHVYEPEGVVMFDILDENVKTAGEIVRDVAQELNCTCADLYALTEEHPEWFVDGVHPNREGNQAIARLIFDLQRH